MDNIANEIKILNLQVGKKTVERPPISEKYKKSHAKFEITDEVISKAKRDIQKGEERRIKEREHSQVKDQKPVELQEQETHVGRAKDKAYDIALAIEYLKKNTDFMNIAGKLYFYNGKHLENITDMNIAIAKFKTILGEKYARSFSDYRNMYKHIMSDDSIMIKDDSEIVRNRDVIVFSNGTYDVISGVFHENTFFREANVFNMIETEYDPDDDSGKEIIDRFIEHFSGGVDELKKLFWEIAGTALSNYSPKKSLILFSGVPDSGKSSVLRLFELIVGNSLFVALSLDSMLANYALADLEQARIVADDDVAYAKALNPVQISNLKKITSSGKIKARQIYCRASDFRPECMYILASNGKLRFNTTEDLTPLFNRTIVYPLNHPISREKQDPHFVEKLYDARNYLIRRSLQALRELRERNFQYSEYIDTASFFDNTSYAHGIDDFVDECCELEDSNSISSTDLYAAYVEFCKGMYSAYSMNKFIPYLIDKYGVRRHAYERYRAIDGIKIKDENLKLEIEG